jgi:uracil-DNA glycosylase
MTNAVLCLKHGGMQAKVRPEWFENCGSRFLRPTIDLIAPKVVVSLSESAYRAITAAYGVPPIPFRKAVD